MSKRKKLSAANTSRLRLWILILAVSFFLIISIATTYRQILKIEQISCQFSNNKSCPTEITAKLETLNSKPFFFTNFEQFVTDQIAPTYPVTLARVEKRLPNKVLLVMQPEPAAYLLTTNDTQYQVSHSGLLFNAGISTDNQLISVKAPGSLIVNEKQLDTQVHQAIKKVITTGISLELEIEEINWQDQLQIEIKLKDKQEVFVIDADQITIGLHRLKAIIQSEEYNSIDAIPQLLDLRFELPVLRTST